MIIFDKNKITFSWTVSLIIKISITAALLFLVYYLRNVLLPFVFAFLLAYLLNPVVRVLQKFFKNRVLAVIFTLLLISVLLTLVAVIILPIIYNESVHLYHLVKDKALQNNWENQLSILPAFVVEWFDNLAQWVDLDFWLNSDSISSAIEKIVSIVLPEIQSFFSKTFNVIASIFGFAIVILYLIFIMLDYDNIKQGWYQLVPITYRPAVSKFAARFEVEMHRYFRGQLSVVAIVTVLYSIGFTSIGLPMGLMLGLLVGFLNLIPYMQMLGFLPALCLAVIRSLETETPLWIVLSLTAGVFVVVQILQDLIITPRIMGRNTGLNPAIILLSLSIWGKLLGFLGLLAALPFTCMVKSYYNEFVEKQVRNVNKHTDVELPSPEIMQNKQQNVLSDIRKKSTL